MKGLITVIILAVAAQASAQDSVTIREVSKNNFIATLLSQSELEIEDAQKRLLVDASKTCKDSNPIYGRYKFKSSKNISSPTPSNNQFQFDQEFTCDMGTDATPIQVKPTVLSDPEKARLVELVTRETQKYLGFTSIDNLEAFHSQFSDQLSTMLPKSEWVKEQILLHKKSGSIEQNTQFKVTLYVDPPNSPGPGVYLAVDFQAKYKNAPFRCGYVMWLFDQQSNLSVLRIEDGIIYDKDAAAMTAEQLSQTKTSFRCFAL
jgi:hypothetical protein